MWKAKAETYGVREDITMRRLVMFVQNIEHDHDQMLDLSTLLGGIFNREGKPVREELDPEKHTLHVRDPELYDDYRPTRVIKDIGVRRSKTPEATGAAVFADPPN